MLLSERAKIIAAQTGQDWKQLYKAMKIDRKMMQQELLECKPVVIDHVCTLQLIVKRRKPVILRGKYYPEGKRYVAVAKLVHENTERKHGLNKTLNLAA